MPLSWKPESMLQGPCPCLAAVASIKSFGSLFSRSVCPQSWSVGPSLVPPQQKSCANQCTVTKKQIEKQAWRRHELHVHQTRVVQNYGCCLYLKRKPQKIQRNPPNLEQKWFCTILNWRTRQKHGLSWELLEGKKKSFCWFVMNLFAEWI